MTKITIQHWNYIEKENTGHNIEKPTNQQTALLISQRAYLLKSKLTVF